MSAMASTLVITNSIRVRAEKILKSREEEGAAAGHVAGEPRLFIRLDYAINVAGIKINSIVKFQHDFADSSPSSLRDSIEDKERVPLELFVNAGEIEHARDAISGAVSSLINDSAGVAGVETLRVKVTVRTAEDEAEFLGKVRMCLVEEEAYAGGRDGVEEEICVICLEEMVAGQMVASTPCRHLFHGGCIKTWFGKAGVCPHCRSRIGPPHLLLLLFLM